MRVGAVVGWMVVVVLGMLGLVGCASDNGTEVVSSSGALAEGRGPVRKVVVVAMLQREELRREMENDFTEELEGRGVNVVPGYAVWPGAERVTGEELGRVARRVGADGIVVAGLVKVGEEVVVTPGTIVDERGGFYPGFVPVSYENYEQPPEEEVERTAVMDVKVFDASGKGILWKARTDTVLMSDMEEGIPGFVRTVVEQMGRDGVVGGK